MSNLRHVNLVLGPVPFGGPARMPARAKFLYRQALGTNNFRIVAETRSVAAEWAMLAGKNVLEIPVALDEMPEETLSISRKDLGIDPDAFVCLLYGTHRSDKDYRTVVCAAMKANSKPWLLFAGPVISDNDPAIVVREAGFSRVSVMNKLLNEEESAGYFHVSNCVVLPYPEAYEKGSAVLLQACKYDLPVIAADTGHLSRFVSEHSTGLLYSPGNAENLAAKMDEMRAILTQDPNAWKDALAAVRRKFGWPSLIKRYLEALDFGQQPDSR